ncbi:AraC family transcriptional regulator [Amycolatopsis sp. NPDC004368]
MMTLPTARFYEVENWITGGSTDLGIGGSADSLRVSDTKIAYLDGGERWGVTIGDLPGATFHVVLRGSAHIEVDGDEPRELLSGDLVMLRSGQRHRLYSAPGLLCEPFDELAGGHDLRMGAQLTVGHGQASARLMCGFYREDITTTVNLSDRIPSFVHVHAGANRPLGHVVQLLWHEAGVDNASGAMVDRLVEVLLAQILRCRVLSGVRETTAIQQSSMLRYPLVDEALATMLEDLSHDWTLSTLSAHLAVSRATLIRHFRAAVGKPPLAYLTEQRMELAAQRLRRTSEPISGIAHSVGYKSEHSFIRAFRRVRGISPGRFRALGGEGAVDGLPLLRRTGS